MRLLNKIDKHWIVAGSAWGSRLVGVLLSLVSAPLLIRILGIDHYAVFVALIGISGWYGLTDLGIGISLQNFISEARAHKKDYGKYIQSTLLFCMILLPLWLFVVVLIGNPLGKKLFENFTFLTLETQALVFNISAGSGVCIGVLGIVYKIWFAEQKGYLANIFPILGAIVSLVLYFLLSSGFLFKQKSDGMLIGCVLALLIPLLIIIITSFVLFIKKYKQGLLVNPFSLLLRLLHRAKGFAVFSVFSSLVLYVDYIIMMQILPPEEIVIYNISTKVLLFAFFFYTAFLQAFWPVCAEELSKGNWVSVRSRLLVYIMVGSLMVLSVGILFFIFREPITRFFCGDQTLNIPPMVILLGTLYFIIRVWTDAFSMALQSYSQLKTLTMIVPIQAVITITAQVYLGKTFGVSGIFMGLLLSFLLTVSWVLPWRFYRLIKLNT